MKILNKKIIFILSWFVFLLLVAAQESLLAPPLILPVVEGFWMGFLTAFYITEE